MLVGASAAEHRDSPWHLQTRLGRKHMAERRGSEKWRRYDDLYQELHRLTDLHRVDPVSVDRDFRSALVVAENETEQRHNRTIEQLWNPADLDQQGANKSHSAGDEKCIR